MRFSSTGEASCLPTEGQVCDQAGFCKGNFVALEEDVKDADSCLAECQLTEDCVWFNYEASSSWCILVQDCDETLADEISWIHGKRD